MAEQVMLRDRPGMKVWRMGDKVIKQAYDDENWAALKNSFRFFKALRFKDVLPDLFYLDEVEHRIVMRYVEETPVKDIEWVRRQTVKLLLTLRENYIIHGDSTAPNLRLHYDNPILLDWDQAIFMHEPKPQKRPKPDAAHIWPAILAKAGDPSRVIRRWLAIREEIEYYLGWGQLVDLGCCWMDVGALAMAEGMHVTGVDDASIHSDCLEVAQGWWEKTSGSFELVHDTIANFYFEYDRRMAGTCYFPLYHDVVLLLSTWPYYVNRHGFDAGVTLLKYIKERCDILVFETQYYGDGPGIEQVKGHDDVKNLFVGVAKDVYPIVTLPVGGRDAERTTWIIR